MDRYNFKVIEEKWQKYWEENQSFASKIDSNKKRPFMQMKGLLFFVPNLLKSDKIVANYRQFKIVKVPGP